MNFDKIIASDNLGNEITGNVKAVDNHITMTIPREKINSNAEYIYAFDNVFSMSEGDEGYYVCSNDFERHSGF